MLVISRHVEEGVVIGPDIQVKVLEIGRNRVRLGIEAPEGALILRGELVGSGWNRTNGDPDARRATSLSAEHRAR